MSEILRKALQHGADCPPPESLIDSPAAFEDHLRSCPACKTELALYRGFEAGEIRSDEKDAVDFIVRRLRHEPEPLTIRSRFFTPQWLGGAALAIAAILVAVGLTSQPRIAQRDVPAAEDQSTLRSAAVTITSPTGDVKEAPEAVQWKAVEGAARYSVTLTEVDGTVIFHRNVTTSEIFLPAETRSLLRVGKRVLLEVTAENGAGTEIARSGASGIRLIR